MLETIHIIGAGAVGKALAVSLAEAGRSVALIRGRAREGSDYIENIEVDLGQGLSIKADIPIRLLHNIERLTGLVLLATKSYSNEDMAHRLVPKLQQATLVLLQNGLSVERPFVNLNLAEIYRGVLFMAGEAVEPHKVSYRPVAPSHIGVVQRDQSELKEIVELLNVPHFQFKEDPNINKVVWEKAILNSVFNSICPLLEADNGVFHREPQVLALAQRMINECIEVAAATGLALEFDPINERALFISKKSDGQLISTLQDMRAGRPTEIDTLNLEIARIADQSNISNAVNLTRLLGEMIQLKSKVSH